MRHPRAAASFVIACVAALSAAPAAEADVLPGVNAIRTTDGCGGRRAAGTALLASPALGQAAQELAGGRALEAALERSGYRAVSSISIHVEGSADEAAITRVLVRRYCRAINDAAFSEAGVFQRGDETWLVLATPFSTAALADVEATAAQVLALVNAARAERRRCGRRRYDATHALTLAAPLNRAAAVHARDMAARSSLDHEGADRSQVAERVTRTGYAWRTVGENIAAGQTRPDVVVADWLASPGHCANIMGPQFTEMGVAHAVNPRSDAGVYWAQVLAAPR